VSVVTHQFASQADLADEDSATMEKCKKLEFLIRLWPSHRACNEQIDNSSLGVYCSTACWVQVLCMDTQG
jgi:hypothetical protein